MVRTRSQEEQEPPLAAEKVRGDGGGVARRSKEGRGAWAEPEDLARGRTRSGALFTRQSRGHYASVAELKRAHPKVFSPEPSFYVVGGSSSMGSRPDSY